MSDAQQGYVMMYRSDSDGDGWWHPIATFDDKPSAQEMHKQLVERMPAISDLLTIENVDRNPTLQPANGARLFEVSFSHDPGFQTFEIDFVDEYDGEMLAEFLDSPFDLLDTFGDHKLGEFDLSSVRVLAKDAQRAREKASPMIMRELATRAAKQRKESGS